MSRARLFAGLCIRLDLRQLAAKISQHVQTRGRLTRNRLFDCIFDTSSTAEPGATASLRESKLDCTILRVFTYGAKPRIGITSQTEVVAG